MYDVTDKLFKVYVQVKIITKVMIRIIIRVKSQAKGWRSSHWFDSNIMYVCIIMYVCRIHKAHAGILVMSEGAQVTTLGVIFTPVSIILDRLLFTGIKRRYASR